MARAATHLLVILAVALLTACGVRQAARAPGLLPAESRIDAVPGRVLVLPVDIEGPLDPAAPLSVLLDDGRNLPAALYWISVSASGAARTDWLPAEGLWSSTRAGADARPPGLGF